MRKLITILVLFIGVFGYSQGGPKVDVIKFRGEVTTTVRNTFDVPTGETWLIWNVTTTQLEIAGSDDVWTQASSDNLGDHTATTDLDLDSNSILNLPSATPATALSGSLGTDALSFGEIWGRGHYFAPSNTAFFNWLVQGDGSGAGKLNFNAETTAAAGSYTTRYTLDESGTPTDATDLVNKSYLEGTPVLGLGNGTGLNETGLSATNAPTDNYLLSFDTGSNGFTWVNHANPGAFSAAGFTGNLATTDDTFQEVFDALDALSVGGGGLTAADIDTFDELNTIVADYALMNTQSVQTVTGKTMSGASNTFTNMGSATIDASGFAGNLTTADATLQAIANAFDVYDPDALNVTYDNTTSGLTAVTVEGALDELAADVAAITPGTPPFADTNSIVEGSADGTKELRIEVDGLTTATTRVITMKDENIDLNNMVESKTEGLGGAGQVLNVVFGVKDSIDTWSADANRLDICTDCKTPEVIQIACSDLTTDITTGNSKAYFRMPWAATLTDVRVSLLTAGTSTGITVDINESGTSVLHATDKLKTDATEGTSTTYSGTAVNIIDNALADDAVITIDFDAVPTDGAGVIVTLYVEY